MSVANVSVSEESCLPAPLQIAQDAIHLPEVQEMLRRLAAYNLGIFMPHKHDEQTGRFEELPEGVMQVESGLEVTFQSAEQLARTAPDFVPVGWFWRDGASSPLAMCKMGCVKRPGDTMHYSEHQPWVGK